MLSDSIVPANNAEDQNYPKIDLKAYSVVRFEEQRSIAGVRYTTTMGETTWTPVTSHTISRKAQMKQHNSESSSSDQESTDHNFQSTIKPAQSVTFLSHQV